MQLEEFLQVTPEIVAKLLQLLKGINANAINVTTTY